MRSRDCLFRLLSDYRSSVLFTSNAASTLLVVKHPSAAENGKSGGD